MRERKESVGNRERKMERKKEVGKRKGRAEV